MNFPLACKAMLSSNKKPKYILRQIVGAAARELFIMGKARFLPEHNKKSKQSD